MKKADLLSAAAACLLLASCGDPVFEVKKGAGADDIQAAVEDILDSYDEEDKFRVLAYLNTPDGFRNAQGLSASKILERINAEYSENAGKHGDEYLSSAMRRFKTAASDLSYGWGMKLPCGPKAGAEAAPEGASWSNESGNGRLDELFARISFSYELSPDKPGRLVLTLKNGSDLPVTQISLAGHRVRTEETAIEGGIQPGEEAAVELKYYLESGAELKNGDWMQIQSIVFRDEAADVTLTALPWRDNSFSQIDVGGKDDLIYHRFRAEEREKFLKQIGEDAAKAGADTDICAGYAEYEEKVGKKLADLTAGAPGTESGAGTSDRR